MSSQSSKWQEGVPWELQTSQPHLNPWKDDGTAHPEGHLQTYGRQEGDHV